MCLSEAVHIYLTETQTLNVHGESVTVAVIGLETSLLAFKLDTETAATLIALVSEDPSTWEQAKSVWPRYRTKVVSEFADDIPFEVATLEEIWGALDIATVWVTIDFIHKRVFTSDEFMAVQRDDVFAMVIETDGKQRCPLSIHLPPWWELHAASTVDAIQRPRQSAILKPFVDRSVLYGDPLLRFIAEQTLRIVKSNHWLSGEERHSEHARYSLTLQVHREWLMTPRTDLDGKYPRQILHGALDWCAEVTWGQRLRFEDGGPMIAAPNDWPDFEYAPIGDQEICIYFDLCRAMIEASWLWLIDNEATLAIQGDEETIDQLNAFLRDAKQNWLSSPFEGMSIPNFVLQCDRRRVPRGAGVEIQGICGVQSDLHLLACGCPLCEMMSEGHFGVGFARIDGHYLELDDEFAFSKAETFEQWKLEQEEFEQMCRDMESAGTKRALCTDDESDCRSVWSSTPLEDARSRDIDHVTEIAFKVTEIVSRLIELKAPKSDTASLNSAFANYRHSNSESFLCCAQTLKSVLEGLADSHPTLVPQLADLQSLIDENLRGVVSKNREFGDR